MRESSRPRREVPEEELGTIERSLEQLFVSTPAGRCTAPGAAAGVVISQPGFQLLRRIQEEGGIQIGELARLTEMDPAATGRQVGQLEADGLVTRKKDSDDGRAVRRRGYTALAPRSGAG